ncbi:hypothetical protein TraAM80_03784 [Trypanosoma rangeli]|uniref:Uncharacterized protein n=1 Tax=Trypanosoma rangeli TaxID=5698 RepID=A0A3R7MRF4_TRYRA|nr:uncharacterized protein TraAM80_03784 [Trypanosoma rangeli]RNF06953.1 hypothetical protein TraAM80_03784 [Trypanosoma rangeli]|eukprot:RNF06953.1 hypothetical protein TraAM80_03784 [Trypanosoma rangeli]
MQAGSSLSRRVRVGGVEPEDAVLRAELFRTFAGYGVIEEARFEEDHAFHSGEVIVQFQRLSASEKLQNDVEAMGRRWGITFLPPVVHVGTELLVTSPKTIDTAYLRSLVAEGIVGVTIEEKLLSFPGATRSDMAAAVESAADVGSKDVKTREAFTKALACVRAHAVGRFAVMMSFATVHDANEFLSVHQLSIATTKDLYVVHVGPNAALQRALKQVLLTRRLVKEVAQGSVLRGFVLPQRQGGSGRSGGGGSSRMVSCEVDAGLTRKGRPVLLRTQTNFVKVNPWDLVEVRLTSADSGADEKLLEAELRSVVNTELGIVEAQRPTALLQQLRQLGGLSSSSISTAAASRKVLAGKLYQALQARKAETEDAGEQLHGFPQGLHAFSVVSVCIQRVGNDGLYARTIPLPHTPSTTSSRGWPVFIPSLFVPREAGMSWQDFAVPGERMTVTLLYATAVGASEAALRLVATKREADMRRASAFATRVFAPDAVDGAGSVNTTKPLTVGTSFSASRAVWLPRTPSTDNPVYILLPSSSSPAALFTVTVLTHATETVADQPPETMTMDAGLHPFVISDVVDSDRRGHYAVAMEEEAYRQMEAERRAVELQKESEQDALLQRILTEVLSNGTSAPAGGGEESLQGRKRLRSPGRG